MALADYAHWNEDAAMMWWQEEGRHVEEPPEYDPYDYDEYEDDEDECYDCIHGLAHDDCDDAAPVEYVREDFGWAGMTE